MIPDHPKPSLHTGLLAVLVCAAVGACTPPRGDEAPPTSQGAVPAGDNADAPAAVASDGQSGAGAEMLQSSDPADGAVLSQAPEQLRLTFTHPMRLAEVTVTGPGDKVAPMMVTAAGAQQTFSVPLPDLGTGAYQAAWRAVATDHEAQGTVGFTVR